MSEHPGVEAGMRAQLERWRARVERGDERVGWKIGLNVPAVQERLGLERPAVGHLLASGVLEPAEPLSLAGTTMPGLEPEIAIHLDAELAVAGVGPAVEVVDIDQPFDDIERILAANIFHRAVAFGPLAATDALDDARVSVTRNGERAQEAAVEVDVAGTVELVADRLRAAGEDLRPGDRIIAGSLTPVVPLRPGDRVAAEFGALGRLEIRFT